MAPKSSFKLGPFNTSDVFSFLFLPNKLGESRYAYSYLEWSLKVIVDFIYFYLLLSFSSIL